MVPCDYNKILCLFPLQVKKLQRASLHDPVKVEVSHK